MTLIHLTFNNNRINPWLLAVVAWTGLIFFSSTSLAYEWCEDVFTLIAQTLFHHVHSSDPPYGIIHLLADKSVHVGLFLVLAVLLWKTLPRARWTIAAILLAGAFVGSCSEFLQRFFPGRDPAVRDVLINIGGTALGIALNLAFTHRDRTKGPTAGPELELKPTSRLVD